MSPQPTGLHVCSSGLIVMQLSPIRYSSRVARLMDQLHGAGGSRFRAAAWARTHSSSVRLCLFTERRCKSWASNWKVAPNLFQSSALDQMSARFCQLDSERASERGRVFAANKTKWGNLAASHQSDRPFLAHTNR